MNRKFVTFLNSLIDKGMSGADNRFMAVGKRLTGFELTVVTSRLGEEVCVENGLRSQYVITTQEAMGQNMILVLTKRIIKGFFLKLDLKEGDILYSTSDLLPDTLPAAFQKFQNKGVKWLCLFNLIAPDPLYGYEQYYRNNRKKRFPTLNSVLFKFAQLLSVTLMKYFADAILASNGEIKDYAVMRGVDPQKIVVVAGGGIDFDMVNAVRPLQENKYDACFLGRFHAQKGIFDLIEIWERVCNVKRNAKLAIIGAGFEETEREIRCQIRLRNLETNIDLLGRLTGLDRFKILKSSKLFLFPSSYESWGTVAAEGMVAGLPVIAYDLPIFKGIFPKGMLRVPKFNKAEFAKETLYLLHNAALRNQIKEDGHSFVKTYDWDLVAEREMKIIENLTEENLK